jgi:hypothetical protein
MTRHVRWLALALALSAAVVAGACEPTEPPAFARRSSPPASARPTAGATNPGGSGAPSGSAGASGEPSEEPGGSIDAPTGSPRIEIAGDMITVLGTGDKNTGLMTLDGDYHFTVTACAVTGQEPFVWVYEEFGQSRGTYVDPEFTVKNLKGDFYLRVSGDPTCVWTITLDKAA